MVVVVFLVDLSFLLVLFVVELVDVAFVVSSLGFFFGIALVHSIEVPDNIHFDKELV